MSNKEELTHRMGIPTRTLNPKIENQVKLTYEETIKAGDALQESKLIFA